MVNNLAVIDTLAKLDQVMKDHSGKKIRVAYSGGADSDNVMHLLRYRGYQIIGVFYDTGLEYQATWDHLDYMRGLGFSIEIIKAKRSIPTSQKKHGHPFINKKVSEYIERLQTHNFDFQGDGLLSFEELYAKYPQSKSALRWWCNTHYGANNNILYNRYLKEFLIDFGIPFKVSGKCCDGAKKVPIKEYTKDQGIDLMLLGIRHSEGGQRASTYKNCYLPKRSYTYDMYFPLFWWTDSDRKYFEDMLSIQHSKAYTEYGLNRTGCAGCPFGRNFDQELAAMRLHEPKLEKGVNTIFGEAYVWARKYREYVAQKNQELNKHGK